MKKCLRILLICIILIGFVSITSYGFSVNDMTGKDLSQGSQASIDNFGQGVIKIITTIGSICSVVVLIILGIKYMMGSLEERAEYKKTLMPYVIGAVMVFAASSLVNIIYNIAINL